MKNKNLTKILTPDSPRDLRPEALLRNLHSFEGRLAEFITTFAGSMPFVYLHILVFTVFFLFQPFPVEVFNIFLSLEAIFLATFIMIAQNRQALVDTYRELEDEQEQKEEEQEQEELEEEVQDIQQDLEDIKKAILLIQKKVTSVEKTSHQSHTPPIKTTN